DTLRHAEKRGGAACLLLLKLDNFTEQQKQRGGKVMQQGVLAFSRRLRQSVRPMDRLCRLDQDSFALITHQPSLGHCDPGGFRRLHDTLNHRAYQTAAGFLSLTVSMVINASDGSNTAQAMLDQASTELEQSRQQQRIVAVTANA
ncbi:MAG: diguanylate cyclase, partial [Alcanivorax sp.]|nr:diguanylate cyclase [Alcanivorax sp.]